MVAALFAVVGCQKEDNTYSGAEYIGFADTLTTCPIFADGRPFEIKVASSVARSYDRKLGVEVVDNVSTAIEGQHYRLRSNTVTIKAGETSASLEIEGIYDNLESTDSVGVQLRLITDESQKWELYPQSQDIKVNFAKICDLDINAFTGYCIVTSSYITDFVSYDGKRLVTTRVNPESENSIIVENLFHDGDIFRDNFDITLHLSTDDPLMPYMTSGEGEIIANTRLLFGEALGDGWVRSSTNPYSMSFYNSCQGFAFLVHDVYVDGVGTVGSYGTIFEWISDAEAKYIMNNGF